MDFASANSVDAEWACLHLANGRRCLMNSGERDALRELIRCVKKMVGVTNTADRSVWMHTRDHLGMALEEYRAAETATEPHTVFSTEPDGTVTPGKIIAEKGDAAFVCKCDLPPTVECEFPFCAVGHAMRESANTEREVKKP